MAARRHITGLAIVIAWFTLLVLTAASWGAANLALGAAEAPVAIGIAVVKSLVVVYVFMHLAESRFVTRMVVLVSALFVVILVVGIIGDVSQRRELPGEGAPGAERREPPRERGGSEGH